MATKCGSDYLHVFMSTIESPDAPTNLEVLEVKSRTVKLSWKRPYDGNSPVLSYLVQYKPLRSLHDQAVLSSPEEEWKGPHIFNLTLPSVGVATRYYIPHHRSHLSFSLKCCFTVSMECLGSKQQSEVYIRRRLT